MGRSYIATANLPHCIVEGVNVALNKTVYADPPATNLNNTVDGDFRSAAFLGNGRIPIIIIAVDLGSHYVLREVFIFLGPNGKAPNVWNL